MNGKRYISIDASEFVKGASTSNYLNDGGIRPGAGSFNLTYEPGILHGVPATVDKSGSLTGNPIGWTPNGFVSGGIGANGFIICSDGKVGAINSSQTIANLTSAITGTYTFGITDIAQFLTFVAISSTDNIAYINTDLTGSDNDWGTAVLGLSITSGAPHPLLNYKGYLYMGDARNVHRISSSAAASTYTPFSQENTISAMGIDSSSGRILIASVQNQDLGGAVSANGFISVWDGESPVPEREVRVEGMITAIRNVGGTTFMWMKDKIGYWNGSGFSFLRKLGHITLGTSSTLPWKHHTAVLDNTVYTSDGTRILAYGDVLPGRKVFYYAGNNDVNSNEFTMIAPVGNQKLGLGFSSSKFYTLDMVGTGVGTFNTFSTNVLNFPVPVHIRHVFLEYAGSGVANGYQDATMYYLSGNDPTAAVAMSSIYNTSGGTLWEIKNVIGVASPIYSVRFVYGASDSPGIKRMVIYYDPIE